MLYIWDNEQLTKSENGQEFLASIDKPSNVVWLDLEADETTLQQKLEALNILHPLTIERVFTKQPRAFLDEFEDYFHILLQEIHYYEDRSLELKVCHFIIGSNFLVTIHPQSIEAITSLNRTKPPSRFFNQGSDILFYHIAELLINASFNLLDSIAELTEDIESRIFPKPDRLLLNELFNLKRDLITIRKTLAPMREVFSMLSRRENPFVDQQALPFMSHLYDQLIRLHELSDMQREIVSGAQEIYLSSLSNRMNEVMMTLTIVSTVILPPTLIVGYYGMNFKHFPELDWKYGLLLVFLLIVGTISAMLWYFKKKNWF
jgi:magnesium transporter